MINDKILSKREMKTIFGSSEYIRKYRDEVCLSQEYMASRLGISQSTYQKIETGTVKVSRERLAEIAEILGKQIIDFERPSLKDLGKEDILALKEIITIQANEIERLKNLLNQKETAEN
ncbi:helix-turn-helix domain-containing protein [Pedobacter sp. UC225_61]|uniref:helix-turn-helix domain-containing protein n=1 Tax=Pedobacter sp. UC225_61 TaxID=3374623 RepID=UPI0037A2EB18